MEEVNMVMIQQSIYSHLFNNYKRVRVCGDCYENSLAGI